MLADIILPVLEDLCQHTKGEKIISINRDNFYTKYHETMARVGCREAGAVKRLLGWAGFFSSPRCHSKPFQSIRVSGISSPLVSPSHHTVPSAGL